MIVQRCSASKRAAKFTVVAAIGAAVLVGGGATAGAADGCGTTEVSLQGVRLLNNGVDDVAGPFPIDLAPGTYDITMRSRDAHDEHYQPEQENEQWYFTLDSGYTSAPSTDISTDQNNSSTNLSAQEIGASTSVTVHHLRSGGVNSVDPICIGFTTALAADDEAPAVADDVSVVEEEISLPEEVAPEPVEAEVKGIVEVPGPSSQLVPPISQVNRPAAVQAAQAPAPQLAITGPSATTTSALLGSFLVMLGLACTWTSGRGLPKGPAQRECRAATVL